MKRFTILSVALTMLFMANLKPSQAQETSKTYCPTNFFRICFTDTYGYKYLFKDIDLSDCNKLYATGVVKNILSYDWYATMWVDFSGGGHTGTVEVHAVNTMPDGCTSYTDSFIYVGTMTITNSGGVRTYSGSGSWSSYCSGSVFSTGTWAASGPCGAGGGFMPQINTGAKNPAKISTGGFLLKIAPNPVKNNTNISYDLVKSANVNITIYNMMNQPVKVLVNENQSSGKHVANWTGVSNAGSRVPDGIYKVIAIVDGKQYAETLQVLQ